MTEDEKPPQKPVKKTVTADELYRRSSQFNLWSFTEDSLLEIRRQANENGRAHAIEKFTASYHKLESENREVFETHQNDLSKDSLLDLISLEEEIKYLNFYSKNIIQAANFFRMPTQVRATAISFFKKFYLYNSVMQYHPKNVLYTCLFLAAKSENYFISIELFCKALQKTEPKDVLDLEFIVLQSLKFTLLVHHPFRPLYGFFLDFQLVLLHPTPVSSDITMDVIGHLYDEGKKWLNDYGLLSDIGFLFTPPQIALAALYDCNRRVTEKYLKKKFLKQNLNTIKEEEEDTQPKNHEFSLIMKTIRKCVEYGKKIEESTREESTRIDRKCFFAINPDKLINKRLKKLRQENEKEQSV